MTDRVNPDLTPICINNFCLMHTGRRVCGNLVYLLKKAFTHLLFSVFIFSNFIEM